MKLSLENKPLFMYPSEEPIDESESYLIGKRPITDALFTSTNRASLVLIENASEVARRFIFDHKMVPIWGKQIAAHFGKRWVGVVDNNVKSNKKYVKKPLKVGDFGIIHNHDGKSDSHFGAFIVDAKGVRIYDSMCSPANVEVFARGLSRKFTTNAEITFYVRTRPFQETGGFYGYLSERDRAILDTLPEKEAKKFELSRLNESEESQNHFCYMWSLYNLVLHFSGKDPDGDYGNPLVLIKKFIYSLIANKNIQKKELFNKWFLTYWKTETPYNHKPKTLLASIPKPKVTENIVEAFLYST